MRKPNDFYSKLRSIVSLLRLMSLGENTGGVVFLLLLLSDKDFYISDSLLTSCLMPCSMSDGDEKVLQHPLLQF